MRQFPTCTRRDFVKRMGCSSLGAVSPKMTWLEKSLRLKEQGASSFAYVGYCHQAGQGIQVFAVCGERWIPTQTITSEHPSFLALHPNQRFLYAVNTIDCYQGLPSGSLEAYAIDPGNGGLTLLNREPLSLSAIMPRHLAISPDGLNLVVAASGGGAYNVFPIGADGRLGRVSGILKETGSGPNRRRQEASHPQMVMFDTTGRHVLGTDLGCDRLNVFAWANDRLTLHERSATKPGSGPYQMALHPTGELIYVRNEIEASITCYGYDAANGKVLARQQHVTTCPGDFSGQPSTGTLTIHPSGRYLYLSNNHCEASNSLAESISVWRIDDATGVLTQIDSRIGEPGSFCAITISPDGRSMLVLSQKHDSVLSLNIDFNSGQLGLPVQMAKLPTPVSVVVKYR